MHHHTHELRMLVATACRVLAASEHGDYVWGHASVRDLDGRGVWLKQGGYGLEEITADRVHLVDGQGKVLDGDGQRHSEYPIHTEIMAQRHDVGAVVHTHPRHCVALAASGQPLLPVSHEANFFVPPEVPRFTDTADLILTPELGKSVATALGSAKALFLVNHGIVTVGEDLPSAVVAAVLLERAARQQLLTQEFGGRPHWSSPQESLAKRGHIYHRTGVRQVWDYLVRTLDAK